MQYVHKGRISIWFCLLYLPVIFQLFSEPNHQLTSLTQCSQAFLISNIHHILSRCTTTTFVCVFVLCRLNFCIPLLAGCPTCLLYKLQKVQSSAAHLVCLELRNGIMSLLSFIFWLAVHSHICYKLSVLCLNFLHAPALTISLNSLTSHSDNSVLYLLKTC